MKDTSITFLMFELIDIIDRSEHSDVSCEEVLLALKGGNIVNWLVTKFPNSDFSIYNPSKAIQITKLLLAIVPNLKSENGICWLLSLSVELLQHKDTWVKAAK